ncbi:hypothetical protein E2C01_013495 [Portunus trituberculatus]|uniref:Uncharacterized protein n=1 Tax=Portunus trituberculatus TaxID=210409 RepID=A0A5B7DH96_PORTR|nr:hypothetical protein [Portunus trituberculatus]
MGLLKQLVITVLVIGVSSTNTEQPPETTVSSTPTPTPSSSLPVISSSTIEPPADIKEPSEAPVVPSASIRQVETPAVVEEVPSNWSDDLSTPEDEVYNEEYVDDHEYAEYPGYYYYDEEYVYEDYETYNGNDTEFPTEEDFQKNVPASLHDDKELIISRDNVVPIIKTLVLACTGKQNPTYAELLKAGGLTAFKTSLKHLGDEKLGVNLLTLAKKLTSVLDNDESEKDAEEEFLSEMAQEFLGSHRFKLVLPESILLHEEELKELLAKRMEESEVEGRSATSEETFSPAWVALLTGLLSIPYFMSDDSPPPVARADRLRHPFRQLRPPSLPPALQHQQLRRDQTDGPPQNQPLDEEFLEYKKKYAQWYHQWYLKHKEYYDKNYPFNPQGQTRVRPPPVGHPPPVKHAKLPGGPRVPPTPRRKPKPPPQRRRKPAIQNTPPQRGPPKLRRVRPGRLPPKRLPPPTRPQAEGFRDADHSPVNDVTKIHPNTFGTFQSEGNHGDSHFRVFHGQEGPTPASVPVPVPVPVPSKVPSPQPVYIPTTNAPPTTETGFKPIIKPDAPVSDDAPLVRTQTVSESVLVPKQVKPNFRPPKQDDLLVKDKPTPGPKKTPVTVPELAPGGFKPIPWLTGVSPETTTRRVSSVTSGVFKTTPENVPTEPTTPRPAVFVRTEKSVRVVTSSSVVAPQAHQAPVKQVPRKQSRHQESQSFPHSLQVTASLQAEESKPTAIVEAVPVGPQFLRSHHPPPAVAPGPNVLSRGSVRTNVPTNIRVVDHRRPQGFGLGPKPSEVIAPSTTTTTTTTTTTSTTQAPLSTPTTVPVFALDPFYGSRLSRIDVIFHQLKVEGEGCREQLSEFALLTQFWSQVVCNIYKNPEAFTPFSDFLSRQLTVTLEELRRPKVSDERILRFFRYLKAARDGQDGGECLVLYSDCAQDTNALSHQPILNTYQKVSRLMDVSSS